MSFKDLVDAYDFHDSLITKIQRGTDVKTTIDFCHWKQEYYNSSMSETGAVNLLCHNAIIDSPIDGDIDYYSILDVVASDTQAIIKVLDDFNDTEYTTTITSARVKLLL